MSEFLLFVIGIVVLQAFSAFFSGSETALTTASRARLHQMKQQGSRRAGLTESLQKDNDKLLGTILVGNTFVNTAAASLGTTLLTRSFGGDGNTGAIMATLIITVTLLIFSEVLPKTLALRYATQIALLVAPAMWVFTKILAPFTWGIIVIVRSILFFCGAQDRSVSVAHQVEELKGAIDLHRGPDAEVAQERAMLSSILELSDITVDEAMTHRRQVETLDANISPFVLVEEALASNHTRLPLWQGDPDNIIGLVHARALFRELQRLNGKLEDLDIRKVTTPPWFIPASATLLEQLQAFRARREHFAMVVDEYGVFMGIITLEDILEEIVGDIEDEHDEALPGVVPHPNGSFVADGTVSIRELNRLYDWQLPDTGATTLGGFVLFEVRRVPDIGQIFEFYGYRFEILKRQRNQITQLRIFPPTPPVSQDPPHHAA